MSSQLVSMPKITKLSDKFDGFSAMGFREFEFDIECTADEELSGDGVGVSSL